MFNDLADIKILRKKMGLTQGALAKRAGVSQSLIAKIESSKIDPTFTNAKKIFDTLANMTRKSGAKAFDLMNPKVVYAKPEESITQVITDMKKHGISQLPVIDDYALVGVISETTILDAMLAGKKHNVREIMEDRPPCVSKETPMEIVSSLLKYFQIICVFDKEKIVGIITKSDLISKL
jgi:predicted transcriptional regulator